MLFHTARFFVFLAVVWILYYNLPERPRKLLLLAASYYFYSCWNAKFLLLILFLTAIDYSAALIIDNAQARWKKPALIASLLFILMLRRPPRSSLFPDSTLKRTFALPAFGFDFAMNRDAGVVG